MDFDNPLRLSAALVAHVASGWPVPELQFGFEQQVALIGNLLPGPDVEPRHHFQFKIGTPPLCIEIDYRGEAAKDMVDVTVGEWGLCRSHKLYELNVPNSEDRFFVQLISWRLNKRLDLYIQLSPKLYRRQVIWPDAEFEQKLKNALERIAESVSGQLLKAGPNQRAALHL